MLNGRLSLCIIGDYAEVIQLNILSFVPLHCLSPSWKQNAISKMYLMLGSNAGVILFAIRKLFLLWSINKDSPQKGELSYPQPRSSCTATCFCFCLLPIQALVQLF